MTKLQLLHRALNERLMAAVEQIMEMVGGTVLEYEEETIRARKENEVLRRRLRWMEGANPTDWPDDPDPSQQDECAVNFTFEQGSEALVIKTETTDHPLYNAAAVPQSVDQGADVAGTSTGISCGMGGGMTWDSAQSYMAPLDFDPTSGNTRVRHWRGRNRRQRMSFACPDCGKVFGREQRLMIHMRIHSNERPYKYRRRKAFFYGDNKKKRKLQALSQLSGEIVVDLSDCSEQTNRSSASPEQLAVTAEQKEGPGGLSTESDHSDKETENRTTTPACHQRKKKRGGNPVHCYCPHCPDRVFARPCQLAMHMKTHTVKALVNLPSQAQSGTDEKMDLNLKSQKRQRKNDAVKKAKDAGKSEFRCPKCDRVFAFECRLRFHMKSHKAKRSLLRKTLSPIQTEPAKEETMEPVPKTTDVQYLQEVKKTFACPHCDKVFIREGWLQPHIRSQHRKVKKKRSQFEILLDDSRHSNSRSLQAYNQLLRKRTPAKQGVTEDLKQKNKESKKVHVKPTPSSDESNLVVAGYTQQLRKPTTETQGVTKELKQKNEDSKKVNNKPSQSSDESNLVVAGYTQQLCKRTTDTQGVTKELKMVSDKPSPSSESNLVVDVPKITTDEAEQSAFLLKRGTEESKCSPEQSKEDTSDCDRETSVTTKPKRILPCKECGKEFVQEKKLKKHLRKHVGFKLRDERERKRKEGPALREDTLMEQPGMRWEEEDKERLDKTSTSNHNPNTTPQGSPNKELRKGKTRGQGPLPCPFCGKVFAWEMRLLMHMEIHCGEKPYSYRQRKDHFYGDPKRGQLPKIHNQEPPGNNSYKSDESAGEEMVNEDRSVHLSSSKTHAVSGALASVTDTTVMEDCTDSLGLLPQTAIEQPTTCNKSNQKTKPVLSDDVLSHCSLQPRIVLEPIMTECKYWSSVSGDLNSGHSEKIGCDREETSCTVLVGDEMMDAVEDKIVGSDHCILPVEGSGHGTQNKPEIHHSIIPLTEIFSIEVGSPQCQPQLDVELDNLPFGGQMAVESSERNNTESQQKENSDCYFPCVSEKTAINMVHDNQVIIIDDELVQSNASTAEHASSECGRMKCDCNNISAMKLTVMPQTSDLQSLFKETSSAVSDLVCVFLSDAEDNDDEDVLNSSKGLDDKRTASVPSIQNEQFDVDGKPAKNPSSDSNSSAPDAIESIKADKFSCVHAKAIDGASEHTDVEVVISEGNDQSTSNNPLTRDQMTSVTNRQTEDNPISSLREVSCQTSVMAFAGQASLSDVNADKKPLDMEIVSGHERKNMKQCEQPGMQ